MSGSVDLVGAPIDRCAHEFGATVRRLHVSAGGDPAAASALAAASARVWAAQAQGHVCQPVQSLWNEEWPVSWLNESPVVGHAGQTERPLILDRECLYLQRLWQAECALAQAILRIDVAAPVGEVAGREEAIAAVFGGRNPDDAQQQAVARALERRLLVLSGGPGTGKSTTLARLIRAFVLLREQPKIALCAPTGKAAARLLAALSAQLGSEASGFASSRTLPEQAYTLHRLLELRTLGRGVADAPAATLDFDLVIVDEASMLDLELAAELLGALPEHARLVLAGDQDQLSSVQAGAVFAQLCAARLTGWVRLEHNHRQADAPELARLAAGLRQGLSDELGDLSRVCVGLPREGDPVVAASMREWAPVFPALAASDPAAVLAAYDRHRLLVALRAGPLGAVALNRLASAQVRRRAGALAQSEWFPGRLVMVLRNRPDLALFNGDIGVCLRADFGGLMVFFPDGASGLRRIPAAQMPECEDAWAITVHKSQGSEYESVALVPAPRSSPLAVRELVYTGITRARRDLRLWCEPVALLEAGQRRSERHGQLASRLMARGGLAPAPHA